MTLSKKGIRIWVLVHLAVTLINIWDPLKISCPYLYFGSLSGWFAFLEGFFAEDLVFANVCFWYGLLFTAFSLLAYLMTLWKDKHLWFFAMCCIDVVFMVFIFAFSGNAGTTDWISVVIQALHAAAFLLLTRNSSIETDEAKGEEKPVAEFLSGKVSRHDDPGSYKTILPGD